MSSTLFIFGLLLPALLAGLCLALGAWISVQIVQQNGRLLGRLEGLARQFGRLAPAPLEAPAAERRCKCGKPRSECGRGDCDCARRRARAAANGG